MMLIHVKARDDWEPPRPVGFCCAGNHQEEAMPRELIDTGTDKRYVRRDENGQFKESDDVGRSSAQDQKRDSGTKPKRGEGDKGDR
jgi:hypothetical protein